MSRSHRRGIFERGRRECEQLGEIDHLRRLLHRHEDEVRYWQHRLGVSEQQLKHYQDPGEMLNRMERMAAMTQPVQYLMCPECPVLRNMQINAVKAKCGT